MKFAIIGERQQDINQLTKTLRKWCDIHRYTADIFSFGSGNAFFEEYKPRFFHIIFIDTYSEAAQGILIARQIRSMDSQSLIVFLSENDEYVFQAVKLHIFDYIKKPYTPERIFHNLNDCIKLFPEYTKTIKFPCGKKWISLRASDILYIVADNNYTIFKLWSETKRYRIFFSKVSELLDDKQFIVCTRGVAVNFEYVKKENQATFEMADGRIFPIHRKGRKEIIQAFEQYKLEKVI